MAVKKKTTKKVKETKAKKAPAKKVVKRPAAKVVKRRTTTKRVAASKATKTTGRKSAALSVGNKAFTKSQFVSTICEQTTLSRKEVAAVLESIGTIIGAHVQKQGPGTFAWPGLFKVKVVKKPATKARQGTNPFTGEPMVFKAKPASRRVKILPLKQLKTMAG